MFIAALICIGLLVVVSFCAGMKYRESKEALIESELEGKTLALKAQEKKYNELYDSMLRVNGYNKRLRQELDWHKTFIERCGEDVYQLYKKWLSRKDIADHYPEVGYNQICYIIREMIKRHWPSDPADGRLW